MMTDDANCVLWAPINVHSTKVTIYDAYSTFTALRMEFIICTLLGKIYCTTVHRVLHPQLNHCSLNEVCFHCILTAFVSWSVSSLPFYHSILIFVLLYCTIF